CSRVFNADIYGDHVVSCAGIVGIKYRHNVVRDTLVDICYRSGISAGKEVDIGLDGGGGSVTNHYVQQICCLTREMKVSMLRLAEKLTAKTLAKTWLTITLTKLAPRVLAKSTLFTIKADIILNEAFACRCGAEDVVLRESYKPKTRASGRLFWMWFFYGGEQICLLLGSPGASTTPSYSPRPSTLPSYSPGTPRNPKCSNCKLLLRKIKIHQYIILNFTWWKDVHTVALAQLESNSEGHHKKQFVLWLICKVEESGNMCAELCEAVGSDDWVEMLVFYCWRSIEEDFRVARVINKLCEEVAATNEETSYFIQDLDDVLGWVVVTQKTSEFLKDTQEKGDERL
nr:hypothetical protein [Tanacetum cinerariifolium]